MSRGSVAIKATAQMTPIGPVNQMNGALNGRSTSGCVIRMTRTPAETTAKANRVPIDVSSPAMLIGMRRRGDHHDHAGDDRRDPGRAEPGMDLGDGLGQQAVSGHRVEDPRLAQEHDQDHRAQAGDRAELHDPREPLHAHGVDGDGDRIGHVELLVVDDARQDDRAQAVEDRADHQRADDPDRHVALGVLGLLGGRRDRVEADVGEEDESRRPGRCRSSRNGTTPCCPG